MVPDFLFFLWLIWMCLSQFAGLFCCWDQTNIVKVSLWIMWPRFSLFSTIDRWTIKSAAESRIKRIISFSSEQNSWKWAPTGKILLWHEWGGKLTKQKWQKIEQWNSEHFQGISLMTLTHFYWNTSFNAGLAGLLFVHWGIGTFVPKDLSTPFSCCTV